MRFDMHCHTKEGSLDGKIKLTQYVHILKKKGYQGMLISDHNSYHAYRYYEKYKDKPIFRNFTVLKGIEYDTIDAGRPTGFGGKYYHGTTRERIGAFHTVLLYSFWLFNKTAGLFRYRKRRSHVRTFRERIRQHPR